MASVLDKKKILVVDDDPDIIMAVRTAFNDAGASVQTANDGNAGVTIAERDDPDLVVLDIMLPQKSGFLVLERLRQGKPRGSRPRIIMITGNQGRRHKQYAESLGVDAYLSKPFAIERLVEAAEKLLG